MTRFSVATIKIENKQKYAMKWKNKIIHTNSYAQPVQTWSMQRN